MESSIITPSGSQPQCPLILADWQDMNVSIINYDSSSSSSSNNNMYQPSKMVQWFHDSWYRFGKSSDLLSFIQEEEEGEHYTTGLFATILITGIVLLFWMSLIVIVARHKRHKLPPKKQRNNIYRSITHNEILLQYQQDEQEYKYYGRPFCKPMPPRAPTKPPPVPQDDDVLTQKEEKMAHEKQLQDYNQEYRLYQKDLVDWRTNQYAMYKRKIRCTRMTIILACLIIIISSTLFYIHGAKQLMQVATTFKHTLRNLIREDTQQELNRIQEFLSVSQTSNITTILDHTNTYCPLKRPRICPTSSMSMMTTMMTDSSSSTDINNNNNNNCNWTGIPYSTSIQGWTSTLIYYQTNLSLAMYDFQVDLLRAEEEMDSWISFLGSLEGGLRAASVFVFVLDILCVYILIGCVAVAYTKYHRHLPRLFVWIRSYGLIPLFVIVTLCGWIFASVFTLASLTTSDFCYSGDFQNYTGPTEKILALLHQANLSTTLDDLIRHYVTGCSNVFLPDIFSSDISRLVQSVRDTKLLQSNLIIFSARDDMRNTCGPFSESILSGTAHLTQEELCSVASILHESRQHLACSRWDPIYTTLTQDLLCGNAMDAFAWLTISQLVIVFVSMLILTFRVAILPVKYVRWQNPARSKALSKQVTADLQKIQAMSEEKNILKEQAKIEPIYQLGYGSSSSIRTVVSDDNAEVSTAEPSYSGDSNSLQTRNTATTGSEPMTTMMISPKMVDDDDDDHHHQEDYDGSPKKPSGTKVTLMASSSSKQTAAPPIMAQSIQESLDEDDDFDDEHDDDEEKNKPESVLSMRSESNPPPASERTMMSVSSTAALESHHEEEEDDEEDYTEGYKKPESYSMHSESVPESQRSMTSGALSLVSPVPSKPNSAIRTLMDRGAPVRHKSISDDSSFEEVTIRSDSDFEEATYHSYSSLKKSSGRSLSVSEKSEKSGSHHSDRKSIQSRMSGHSQGSQRFLSLLEDVAEDEPLPGNNNNNNNGTTPSANPKVSRFAPGNAFMDHLLLDEKAEKGTKKPPKQLSLPIELSGKSRYPADTTTSSPFNGGSTNEDTTSIIVDTTSDPIEASGRDEGGDNSGGQRNPKRKSNIRESSRSLKNIEAVKAASEQAQGGDGEEFHFSLNLDMATFHSTDFGDFSTSDGSNLENLADVVDVVEVVEYEIIEEIILPEDENNNNEIIRNPMRRSASISALSVDPDDPAYRSLSSADLFHSSNDRVNSSSHDRLNSSNDRVLSAHDRLNSSNDMVNSAHDRVNASGGGTDSADKESHPQMLLWDTSAVEESGADGKPSSAENKTVGQISKDGEKHATVPREIDMHALQKRVDSIRSLGSASAGMPRARKKDTPLKRGESIRSMASGHSIAISAATPNPEHFHLEDDMGGMGGLDGSDINFGNAMLPSRAIDSDMLAIVDETWVEDLQDEEQPSSSQQAKAQMRKLAGNLRPQGHGWRADSKLSLGSGQSGRSGHNPPANQIFLKRGISEGSTRSVNSGLSDDFNWRGSMGSASLSSGAMKKPSMRSLASGHSVAISAATMDEKQFHLDDDHGESLDNFGNAMLPSRALDSEMLAVVDETWTEDLEDGEMPSSKPTKQQANHRTHHSPLPSQPHRLTGKQIFLQNRADSVRSLGMESFSAGMHDQYDPSFDKPKKPISGRSSGASHMMKKPQSVRSLGGHSVAISAATMNENQFHLDDDHFGSSDSFGHAMLPSRALDSEMLAVVDELEDEEMPSSKPTKEQAKLRTHSPQPSHPHHLPTNQIFLQKGADSVRSLGMDSFSAGMYDDFDGSYDKPMKPMSGLSLGTSPSIAISAATMDEKQFRLDDDMGGSSNSFGLGMLPNRAMDSEMLAVVDEALAEDAPDTPTDRGGRSLQPPGSIETTRSKPLKMDSNPSLGEALDKSAAEISLVDPFEKPIEISAAR